MKHVTACMFLFAAAACVPASEELPPKGAAGYETVPSPETQGVPFETLDDWEITIDRLVLQLEVSAIPASLGYGNGETFLFDARTPARIFSRALPLGPARVHVDLSGRYYYYSPDERSRRSSFEEVTVLGVDDETAARFEPPPPATNTPGTTQTGKSALLVLHARQLATGRIITLDTMLSLAELAPTTQTYPPDEEERGDTVDVREDDLAALPLPLNAGELFPFFQEFADADADGDGRLTEQELLDADLVETLDRRVGAFFGKSDP